MILEPMSADRFDTWSEHHVVSYAQDKVDAGNWPEDGAVERARRENAELLPEGVTTAGHDLFVATVDGDEVGFLWLFTDPAASVPETYVYDIEIVAARRGEGLGRELLEAAEGWCADHGVATLRLHVFGFNTAAISLYESSGFETTNLSMAKIIR
ncbi:GNAT family N-acetyltransferase [Aeromicrobium stalagmiti]|uniref:GNAT family N-acetyltransferase n=1 Tax=Aeromicrobium stalagmiti TaxID=2738988 RepID=UPI001569B44C|nr:GNAT family N-acetyltransferase [Aeromicrobium stalagmiti]